MKTIFLNKQPQRLFIYKVLQVILVGILFLISSHTLYADQQSDEQTSASQAWLDRFNSMAAADVRYSPDNIPQADQDVIAALAESPLPSRSLGIPEGKEDFSDISHTGFDSAGTLYEMLTSVGIYRNGEFLFNQDLGPAIITLSSLASDWVYNQSVDYYDLFPKIALNRCNDFKEITLPIAGRNTAELQELYSGMWVQCYEMAIAYARGKVVENYSDNMLTQLPNPVKKYLMAYRQVSKAHQHPLDYTFMNRFAVEQFEFFYNKTVTNISTEAQATGLIRLLGYLLYDLNASGSRRSEKSMQVVTKARIIQSKPAYKSLVNALREQRLFNAKERANVGRLRVDIDNLHTFIKRNFQEFLQAARR